MGTSCTDQESSTTELSISISPNITPPTPRPPFLSFPTPHDQSLRRVGSGTISVILDSAETSTEAESRKLPSSKFKGVVPQPNGRWGAQIYEKHQRVWLGTFNQQHQAAKAYDVAAQRFRGRYAVTNFKLLYETNEDVIETAFINSHSKPEIVDMLRKHTYNDELQQSKRKLGFGQLVRSEENGLSSFLSNRDLKAREQLFEKAVTPSDVGKLNRLVIPKQHAEKHFPLQNGSTSKATLLNFEDNGGKVWRFRYSYWNSSQSYVLTKGWSRFVKEKNLKAGDIVSFQRSTGPDKQLLYIDWETRNNSNGLNPVGPVPVKDSVQIVRLFGVNIFKVGGSNGGVVDSICGGCNNKRKKEMELLLELDCSKKPRIIGAL